MLGLALCSYFYWFFNYLSLSLYVCLCLGVLLCSVGMLLTSLEEKDPSVAQHAIVSLLTYMKISRKLSTVYFSGFILIL